MATTKKTNLATARATTRRSTKTTATKAKRATAAATKASPKAAPKRSTRKATAAKTKPAKAKATATKARKGAVVAKPAEAFWVCDGAVLHSLAELADALETMDAATYAHHANTEKNDFAAWVEQVLEVPTLATALRRTKTPRSAKLAVRKYV